MSKLQYNHIDLSGATLIQRRHKRQVIPPGMWAVNNFLQSPSDNSLVLRPDFVPINTDIKGMSGDLTLQTTNKPLDLLNSVSGVYGSTDLIYFTTFVPWGLGKTTGIDEILSDSFETGTCTTTAGSFSVVFASVGANDFRQLFWRGCILEIKFGGGTEWYLIDKIVTASVAGQSATVYTTMPVTTGDAGVSYAIYYNHNPWRAEANKLQLDQFASAIIYCSPGTKGGIASRDICGPFYSNVTESDWNYGYTKLEDYAVTSDSPSSNPKLTLATNGTNWIWAEKTGDISFRKTLDITSDDTWTEVDLDDVTWTIPQPNGDDVVTSVSWGSIIRDSTYGYLATANLETSWTGGTGEITGILYSTDNGVTWTVKPDTAYPGATGTAYAAASDGTTVTVAIHSTVDDKVHLRYSTDDGDTWNDTITVVNFADNDADSAIMRYISGNFILTGIDENIRYSADGQTWAAYDVSGDVGDVSILNDVAYNNFDEGAKSWVVTAASSTNVLVIARVPTALNGTYVDKTGSQTISGIGPYYIHYDILGQHYMIPLWNKTIVSDDDGLTWKEQPFKSNHRADSFEVSNIDWSAEIMAFINDGRGTVGTGFTHILIDRSYILHYDVDKFAPLNTGYRSQTFAVIDGYTVLIGTSEWDSSGKKWDYNPKRIRWSVPGSYSDFSGSGSGTADAAGPGAFETAAIVNGRIVVFETTRASSIVPRGDTDDPWDFDVIKENFRATSNPIAVDDICYIIGSDGLLWQSDGINLSEVGSSFDLTKFDDYDSKKPVWLTYSRKQNSLYVYYKDATASVQYAQAINLSNGSVTQVELTDITNSVTDAVIPGSVVSIEGSSEQETYVSHHPGSADTDKILIGQLYVNNPIIGNDRIIDDDDAYYWVGDVESGELYITQEGGKAAVKHLIAETYTAATKGDNSDRPYLVAEVKSIEDSDYATSGDTVGTATMTTSALTGSGTAWSNTIVVGTAAAGEVGPYTLPCQGSQARVYIDSTLQVEDTDYTVSGSTITLTSDLGDGEILYAYWENYPEVKVKVNDFFRSSEGWHRVTAVTTSTAITLDHYLSTGSETVTHYPAWQLDDDHGRVEIGIGRLVEGVQIRLYLIPAYDGTDQSTIAKITGLSIGYVPQGRKIVKATGS